jgi:hypothetical protein
MRSSLSNKFVVPLVVLAIAGPAVGCAAPTADTSSSGEDVGTTTQAIGLDELSGGAGVLSGVVSAYTAIDNFSRYGSTNPTPAMMNQLVAANEKLDSIKSTLDEQFLKMKVDIVIAPIADIESKILREFDAYQAAQAQTPPAPYAPRELTWADLDSLNNRLVGAGGTDGAFDLIQQKMATTGGATDPLGTYAVRMRYRLAQGVLLMSQGQSTPSQDRIYKGQVEQLNTAFLKATRTYYVGKVEYWATQNGGVSASCSSDGGGDDGPAQYHFTVNGGADPSQEFSQRSTCEAARQSWMFLTVQPSREKTVNTIWSQQENFVNWKKLDNTVHVVSATYDGRDVTKAIRLMCNSSKTCSIPGGTLPNRLGDDAAAQSTGLDVTFVCIGSESTQRRVVYPDGWDPVVSCDPQGAIAGTYVNTADDATPGGRRPEDTATLTAMAAPGDSGGGVWWRWADGTGTPKWTVAGWPGADGAWSSLFEGANVYGTVQPVGMGSVTVQWGEDGVPTQILSPDNTWFIRR